MTDQARVLWVTNLAPPYRMPLWRALSGQWRLRVGLLESSERLSRDSGANRGADWRPPTGQGYEVSEYRTVRVRRGEDRHYGLLTPDAFGDLATCDVALLGGWDSPAYFQLLAQAKLTGKAVVGFHESTLASQSRNEGRIARARAAYFRRLDRVVVPGPAARDAVLAMGVEPHRILVGFNAVDVNRFRDHPVAEPHQGHHYLYVGQLIQRKNVDGIVRAFAEIAHEADRLTLIGKGPDKDALLTLATELGIAAQVQVVDQIPNDELPARMAACDSLVLASHVEVWGLVVNEALATGMQAVITRNCGVAASIEGMPGVYLAAADASDLAATMARARDRFAGRIQDPPILQHTPEAFAQVFTRAFTEAIQDHAGARSAR